MAAASLRLSASGREVVLGFCGARAVEQCFAALLSLEAGKRKSLVERQRGLAGLSRSDPQIARGREHPRRLRVLLRRGSRRLLESLCGTCCIAVLLLFERAADQRVGGDNVGQAALALSGAAAARRGGSNCGGNDEDHGAGSSKAGDGPQDRFDLMGLGQPVPAALDGQ